MEAIKKAKPKIINLLKVHRVIHLLDLVEKITEPGKFILIEAIAEMVRGGQIQFNNGVLVLIDDKRE